MPVYSLFNHHWSLFSEQFACLHRTFKQRKEQMVKGHPGNFEWAIDSIPWAPAPRKWNICEPRHKGKGWGQWFILCTLMMVHSPAVVRQLWGDKWHQPVMQHVLSQMGLTNFPRKFWTTCVGAGDGPRFTSVLTLPPSPGMALFGNFLLQRKCNPDVF